MFKYLFILSLAPPILFPSTAKEFIRRADLNRLFKTYKFSATMIIQKGRRKLVKKFTGFAQKKGEKSFMVFTNPEDYGVKYLKLNKELWIYFPDADDIMKISGHMLRQGMMGSDISYEDLMETEEIERKYSYSLRGEETVDGRECAVIELNARVSDAAYAKQVVSVDKSRFVLLKIEMYARGGRLLKTMHQRKIEKTGSRFVPKEIEIRDMRKRNSRTLIILDEVLFDPRVPVNTFTKRSLRR